MTTNEARAVELFLGAPYKLGDGGETMFAQQSAGNWVGLNDADLLLTILERAAGCSRCQS